MWNISEYRVPISRFDSDRDHFPLSFMMLFLLEEFDAD